MVAHVPMLKPNDQPTVASVTSLYSEKLAVDAMIDYKTTYIRCKKGGEIDRSIDRESRSSRAPVGTSRPTGPIPARNEI